MAIDAMMMEVKRRSAKQRQHERLRDGADQDQRKWSINEQE